jgi:hypothetical protein
MADPQEPHGAEDRQHWRRMKRQDTGLVLFEAARAALADLARVKPILFELSRLYNPLVDGPLIDRVTYARIIESLERGRLDEARRLLDERQALYMPREPGRAPGPEGSPGGVADG